MAIINRNVYDSIVSAKQKGQKSFAVLIDPDKVSFQNITEIAKSCQDAGVHYVFMGGSLMVSNHLDGCIQRFKEICSIPVLLFPGSPSQVSNYADALLYLSLISGRNPELLIGQHVISAPMVRASGLEIISTGYIVIDGGAPTTVSYMSGSLPIPHDKADIAVCTAMAGEMLGHKLIYMDSGSGAKNPISDNMIHAVSQQVDVPVIVGGGIRDAETAYNKAKAGADIIVVGNAIEKNPGLINEISAALQSVLVTSK